MKKCPMCDSTDIRKEPDVVYQESEIRGERRTCLNILCNYTEFRVDKIHGPILCSHYTHFKADEEMEKC